MFTREVSNKSALTVLVFVILLFTVSFFSDELRERRECFVFTPTFTLGRNEAAFLTVSAMASAGVNLSVSFSFGG